MTVHTKVPANYAKMFYLLGSGHTVVAQETNYYAELLAKERNIANMDTFYE